MPKANLTEAQADLAHAWSLVTNNIEYSPEELRQLDSEMQRVVRLSNAFRVWKASLPVSEAGRRFQQKLDIRVRRRRQAWHEVRRVSNEYSLHPDYIHANVREMILGLSNGTAVAIVVTNLASDAALGATRRAQLAEFGKRRGSDRHDDAVEEHKPWVKEAQRLWRINRHLSISETARKVKKNLNLKAGLTTIREAIREFHPPKLRN